MWENISTELKAKCITELRTKVRAKWGVTQPLLSFIFWECILNGWRDENMITNCASKVFPLDTEIDVFHRFFITLFASFWCGYFARKCIAFISEIRTYFYTPFIENWENILWHTARLKKIFLDIYFLSFAKCHYFCWIWSKIFLIKYSWT